MSTGESNIIDVQLEKRLERDKACAFFQGEVDDKNNEIWVWLPYSMIEIDDGDGKDVVTVSMPEWFAKQKGLI